MSERKMKITVDQLGKPKVEMIGYEGVGCQDRAKKTIDALSGGRGGEVNFKPEFNAMETSTEATNDLTV